MRAIATSMIAFLVSALVGGIVTQFLAVESGGQEEFIIAFMLSAAVAIAVTVIFFIAQLFSDQRRATSRVAWVLLALYAVASIGLWVLVIVMEEDFEAFWLLVALTLPGLVIILLQWEIFRRRSAPPTPPLMRFGRLGGTGNG